MKKNNIENSTKQELDLALYYPTHAYCIIKLDKEIDVKRDELYIPSTIHYETDGGKVGSMVAPKKYESTGTLLRCTNPTIENLIYTILEDNKVSNEELNNKYTIKVTLRTNPIIELLKIGNHIYEDIVIASVSDIRLIKLER